MTDRRALLTMGAAAARPSSSDTGDGSATGTTHGGMPRVVHLERQSSSKTVATVGSRGSRASAAGAAAGGAGGSVAKGASSRKLLSSHVTATASSRARGRGGPAAARARNPRISPTKARLRPVEDAFGKDEYAWWTLRDVKAACERARKLLKDGQTMHMQFLTRRQFWEVFTDYTRIVDADFLTLPMTHFDRFAKCSGKDQQVRCLSLLLVLTLFCTGETNDQLYHCFHLFDTDGGGTLDMAEMIEFMRFLCTAAVTVNILATTPSSHEIVRIANEMFALADVDGDGTITAREFVSWARSHMMSQRLLTAFKDAREDEKRKGNKRIKNVNGETSPVKEVPKIGHKTMEQIAAERVHRANLSMIASKKVLSSLSSESGFSIRELRTLRKKFLTEAGAHGAITKERFKNLMCKEYPVLRGTTSVDRLFEAFDDDNSNSIDFREFTLGLGRLTNGSTEDRLSLVFEVYDADGDGRVDPEELLRFVRNESSEATSLLSFTDQLLHTMDLDGDGTISKTEFIASLEAQPLLYHTFTKSLAAPTNARQRPVQMLRKANPDTWNMDTLAKLWQERSHLGGGKLIDCDGFIKFMRAEWNVPGAVIGMLPAVFDQLDAMGAGMLSLRTLFNGMCHMVDGSAKERANFFFTLFQHKDDGSALDVLEVKRALMESRDLAESDAAVVNSVLASLSRDGAGEVTLADFRASAKGDSRVLGCFARLFGMDSSVDGEADAQRHRPTIADHIKAGVQEAARRVHRDGAQRGGGLASVASVQKAMSRFRRMSLGQMAATVDSLRDPTGAPGNAVEGGDQSAGSHGDEGDRKHSDGEESKAQQAKPTGDDATKRRRNQLSPEHSAKKRAKKKRSVYGSSAASLAAKEHGKVLTDHLKGRRAEIRKDVYEGKQARRVITEIRTASAVWKKALAEVKEVKPRSLMSDHTNPLGRAASAFAAGSNSLMSKIVARAATDAKEAERESERRRKRGSLQPAASLPAPLLREIPRSLHKREYKEDEPPTIIAEIAGGAASVRRLGRMESGYRGGHGAFTPMGSVHSHRHRHDDHSTAFRLDAESSDSDEEEDVHLVRVAGDLQVDVPESSPVYDAVQLSSLDPHLRGRPRPTPTGSTFGPSSTPVSLPSVKSLRRVKTRYEREFGFTSAENANQPTGDGQAGEDESRHRRHLAVVVEKKHSHSHSSYATPHRERRHKKRSAQKGSTSPQTRSEAAPHRPRHSPVKVRSAAVHSPVKKFSPSASSPDAFAIAFDDATLMGKKHRDRRRARRLRNTSSFSDQLRNYTEKTLPP